MKTEEEKLLDYAKEHYPIGTKFISPQNDTIYVVSKDDFMVCTCNGDSVLVSVTEQPYNSEYISYKGKWAKIISNPQQYQIGDQVKVIKYGCNSSDMNKGLNALEKVEEFILPEVWYVKVTEGNKKVLADWRGTDEYFLDTTNIVGICKWINSNTIDKGYNAATDIPDDNYTFGEEITYEQFLKYVLKQGETKTNMKSFNITREQFKQLYYVACPTWKHKVELLIGETLGLFQQAGTLSYEKVEEMFKAISNDNQSKVFTEIFPDFSNDKSIDLSVATNEVLFGRTDSMIQIYCNGEFKNKAFYLSNDYNWELIDEYYYKGPILIPTRK